MDLSDPKVLLQFLSRQGIQAKKGLGQHFLCSRRVVDAICGAASGLAGILEIGPGPGVLAGPLSELVSSFAALELDERMVEALRESAPRAKVLHANALEIELGEVLKALPEPRGVVSNLPYYITGPLLTRIAEASSHFQRAILMMQREVGLRILAAPGDRARGSLSVYLQSKFNITKLADVPPGAFLPPPKVESIVLVLETKCDANLIENDRAFFAFVRAGFKQPRKTLSNNLVAMGLDRTAAEAALLSASLEARARPGDLDLEDWRRLAAVCGRPPSPQSGA